jgi:hypothetical protein
LKMVHLTTPRISGERGQERPKYPQGRGASASQGEAWRSE